MKIKYSLIVVLIISAILAGQEFTPQITYIINPPIENSVVSFSFEVNQQPDEIDTQIFNITTDSGQFDFTGLVQNDIIGSGWGIFLDGQCDEAYAHSDGSFGADYLCDEALDSEVSVLLSIYDVDPVANTASAVLTIIQSSNPEYPIGFSPAGALLTNLTDGESPLGCTIEIAYLQPDPGNITQGYSSFLNLENLFLTPAAGNLQLTAQFTPEEGDLYIDVQDLPILIPGCTDPTANNFNPNAGWNDGSCQYESVPGDVSGDGVADVIDIVQMVNYILGYIELSPEALAAGDVFPDGAITVLDVVTLVSWIIS